MMITHITVNSNPSITVATSTNLIIEASFVIWLQWSYVRKYWVKTKTAFSPGPTFSPVINEPQGRLSGSSFSSNRSIVTPCVISKMCSIVRQNDRAISVPGQQRSRGWREAGVSCTQGRLPLLRSLPDARLSQQTHVWVCRTFLLDLNITIWNISHFRSFLIKWVHSDIGCNNK